MIYRLGPSRPAQFSEVWLGALTAMLFIFIGKWLLLLYGIYVTNFKALHGDLGGIAAFLLWFYLSGCF